MATDHEILTLLRETHDRTRPHVRYYVNQANNARDVYSVLKEWAYLRHRTHHAPVGAWHRITHGQLVAERKGVEPTRENGRKASTSNANMLDRLAEAGLIEWRPATNPTGTGRQFISLEFRLLPVPVASSGALVAQLVRATQFWHRRRETREERRQRCHRPRKRTGGHGREPGTQLFFLGSRDFATPGRNPLRGVPESRAPHAEHPPTTSRPGGSLAAAPRPSSVRAGVRRPRPLVDALSGALATTGTEPVRVQVTQGGEGTAAASGRLSLSLWQLWCEEIGPADALPADLAQRIDDLADRFDEIRGAWHDPHARERHWVPSPHAASWKATAPILRLDGAAACERSEPSSPSPADRVSTERPQGDRSTAGQGTRTAADSSQAAAPAGAEQSTAALRLYATAVANELQLSIEKHRAWSKARRHAAHEPRRGRR